MSDAAFAELVTTTNYSFLRGASHPADFVEVADQLGMAGIGIADRNTVAGVVRAYVCKKDGPEKRRSALLEAKEKAGGLNPVLTDAEEKACRIDIKLMVGARLVFADGTPDIVAYPQTRKGWGNLTKLLTVGNLAAIKGDCILHLPDLLDYCDQLQLIVLPYSTATDQEAHRDPVDYAFDIAPPAAPVPHLRLVETSSPEPLQDLLATLMRAAPGRVWLGASAGYRGGDRRRLARLARIAKSAGVPLLATNDALYADREDRELQDVLSCIREGTTLKQAGRRLEVNAERHLKPPGAMAWLFRDHPRAIDETIRFRDGIAFTLDQLSYEYPHEPVPAGWEPQAWLEHLVLEAAHARYGAELPEKVRKSLDEEFHLIRKAGYVYYFLTVHDLVKFAREQDPPILCQGRGSAANSIVCFLLGVTSVDPTVHDLLFSRFVSEDRSEPPDIDVDFEHERREEVMQYVYRRYGRHRAGIAATVIHYRSRSALREVAKVLGMSEDIPLRMTGTVWGSHGRDLPDERFASAGLDVTNPEIVRYRELVGKLLDPAFPRHLSQHVGGFVLTQNRLDETVPLHHAAMKDRTFIEWDKDDIDALKLMKVDVLALGMLTCIRKSFELMRRHGLGDHALTVDLDSDDPEVYAMLQRGDSVGVFQVESRAQMNMLPRLKPENLYDLTVQVAIVRPGPIEGDMVHPYLRRRMGLEKVDFPSPAPPHDARELHQLLGKTFGVPLFQEQAMKLAIVAAGFTPSQANKLRRAMATFRNVGTIHELRGQMVNGMVARGYEAEFAERCFKQIEGFGSYGFPESHALSFARLVYVSAWIKCHQPAVFAAALLNSQPMGFYAPAQIVRDAIEHKVLVRPIVIDRSEWDNILEPLGDGKLALRLGLRQLTGFREEWAQRMVAERAAAPFDGVESVARRTGLPARAMRLLADVDAFRSLGLTRRQALWEVRRIPDGELPLFAAARELAAETDTPLPRLSHGEHVVTDYQMTRLSLKGHPMQFLRDMFAAEGVLSSEQIAATKSGTAISAAGVVLIRQRPGKGNAIFITLEDETGVVNVLLWARLFESYRRPVMTSRLMQVEGTLERSPEGVTHLMATRVVDRTAELDRLTPHGKPISTLIPADGATGSWDPRERHYHEQQQAAGRPAGDRARHPRNARVIPKSRDFH